MTTARDIGVLGPLQLGPDATVLGAKQRRLLAALVLDANRAVPPDRLVHALWGDQTTQATTATLHSHVSRLRRHLELAGSAARVSTAGSDYRLEVEPAAVDALLFEQLVRGGAGAARGNGADGLPQRMEDLRAALALWRGRAYPDLADDDVAQAETARLDELRLGASEDLADALIAAGQHAEALADLETLVRQHPYRDRLWSALILARYRSGRQAEALDAFQSYRRALDDELGLAPSAALVQLHQDVLEQAPHLLAPPVPTVAPALPVARPAPAEATPPRPVVVVPETELKPVTVLVVGAPHGARLAVLPDGPPVRHGPAGGPAGADPEELAEALEPLLSLVADVVHQVGGTVLQAGPGGVTAVFGAPTAAEDHALRACLAADRLREETVALLGPAGVSAGIDSGEVLLRAVRSDAAQGYDAVGDPVERARRAQHTADPATIVVGPSTVRLAEGLLLTEPLEADADRPPGVWRRLTGVASSSAWDARARLGLSTLVGRASQLDVLLRLTHDVRGGSGRVAGLVGDPGVGKSRLAYELAARVPADWSVVTVAATPLDVAVPFHPLLAPVRELLPDAALPDGADADARTDRAAALDETAAAALDALLGRRGAGPAADAWAALDPGVQRRRTIAALVDLLLQPGPGGPQLLVVEDAHWLDGETLAVLDLLVDRVTSAPVLLLVTYRPEHDPGWANRPQFTLVRVDPLGADESTELAATMLGNHPSVRGLRNQLATWTGGVPLFLEESVRELTETRTLQGEPGGYVLQAEGAPLRLPPRVHGVLAARIDRLPGNEKRLLQAAAVVGTEGPLDQLATVLATGSDQVEDDLSGLHRADLLYERRHRGERRFVFKHALVHDTAYASLPRSQRRVLHARAMDALGAGGGAESEDALERLAYHATRAERWTEAVDLNQRAGERALARCAYREAATMFDRALDARRRLPADADAEIDLHVQLRPALHALAEFDAALEHLGRAEAIAQASHLESRLLSILLHRSYILGTRGHTRAAVDVVQRALALAEQAGDPLLVAECRLALGQALTFAGDPRPAIVALEHDMVVRTAAPLDERFGMAGTRQVFAHALLGMSRGMLGDFRAAEQTLAEADRLSAAVDRPIDSVVAALGHGMLELQRGRPDRALPVLQPAQLTCTETGMPLIGRWVAPVLAEALTGIGEHAAAQGWFAEALRTGEVSKVPLWQTAGHTGLARTGLALDRVPEAVAHAQQAVGLAASWRFPLVKAVALRLLAEGTHRLGDRAKALEHAQEAVVQADQIGARPELVRAQQLFARLLAGSGHHAEARGYADAAARTAAALGLPAEGVA